MANQVSLNIGLLGIGLDVYWEQFEGLKEELMGYLNTVEERIQADGQRVINFGLVDHVDRSFDVGRACKQQEIDIILLHTTTYALSGTVLPIVQLAKVPVIILNLSPEQSIDYSTFNELPNRRVMTGEWLRHCGACPVPEIANVFKRATIPFFQITGMLASTDSCWTELRDWLEASKVAKIMAFNRMGAMGTYYSGMLDIYTDLTLQLKTFGGHIEILEIDELTALKKTVEASEIDQKLNEFRSVFDIRPDCSEAELHRAAVTSVALDKLVNRYQLGSIAYYHKAVEGTDNEDTITSIILGTSLLTGNHVPVAGEYEIKNVQAMKIMDAFAAGGSFTEYYAMDYKEDVVLMGHDGPGHIAIGSGKVKVRPLEVYHGKVGKGLAIEMQVQHGPVTLLSVVEDANGGLMLLLAEGESVPGPILKIGNTNSRYQFSIGARSFMESWNQYGPAHHCAVGVGHIASKIEKLGKLLNISVHQVC